LVREALGGDPSGEVAKATKAINMKEVLDSGPAPSVAIVSPIEGARSTADLVDVTARVEEGRSDGRSKGVGRVEWRVNGVRAAVVAKPEGGGPVYTLTRKVALDPGDNAIEAAAYNGANLLASLPARATVKFAGPADKAKGKLYILAIRINDYTDKEWVDPVTK
jgi:hypothetical protein